MTPLTKDLLELLVCPKCHGRLTPVNDETGLQCPACSIVYPVRDGIPVMLQEEAIKTEDWNSGIRQIAKA